MTITLVPPVEIHHIPRQQLPHAIREGLAPTPNQKMKMRAQQDPSINAQCLRFAKVRQTIQEILPVSPFPEDSGSFNSPAYDMVQCPECIQSRLSWHAPKIYLAKYPVNSCLRLNQRPSFSLS